MPDPEFKFAPAVRRKLLAWFDRDQRTLPWRADRDPYRIWVSEVMLQQTTVTAVIPYFDRFIAAFPTLSALAAADEQQVLKLWQGLGYYRRARHLLAAARQLMGHHGGDLPDDPEVWAELPGVGRYILGAVLSQAYDRRLPIVEANSLRVLSRLFGSRLDPREGEGKKWVWEAAEVVLPRKRVGDFNQALMELGALICTPDSPACEQCPIRRECVANHLGIQNEIPPKAKRKVQVEVGEVAVVVREGKRVLIGCNPTHAERWANMWELPRDSVRDGENLEQAAERVASERLGLSVSVGSEVGYVKHGVTRFTITLTAMEVIPTSGTIDGRYYPSTAWVDLETAPEYPMSTPHRKLLNEVLKGDQQKRLF